MHRFYSLLTTSILILLIGLEFQASSQAVTFQNLYGTDKAGFGLTSNYSGGHLLAGTHEFQSDSFALHLIDVDSLGDTNWTRTYRGPSGLGAYLTRAADSGYIVTSINAKNYLSLIATRIDSSGNVLWNLELPNVVADFSGLAIERAPTDEYILAGATDQYDNNNRLDVIITKINDLGQRLWTRTFGTGNNEDDFAYDIAADQNGNYVIVGKTKDSNDEDYGFAMAVNSNGDSLWTRYYDNFEPRSVKRSDNGGLIVGGVYGSFTSDNKLDAGLVKMASDGSIEWAKAYGGIEDDYLTAVANDNTGGYIIAGGTNSYGSGDTDIYFIRTDLNGDTVWTKTIGTNETESAGAPNALERTSTGFILLGLTETFNTNFYLIRLDLMGLGACNKNPTRSFVIDVTIPSAYLGLSYDSRSLGNLIPTFSNRVPSNTQSRNCGSFGPGSLTGSILLSKEADFEGDTSVLVRLKRFNRLTNEYEEISIDTPEKQSLTIYTYEFDSVYRGNYLVYFTIDSASIYYDTFNNTYSEDALRWQQANQVRFNNREESRSRLIRPIPFQNLPVGSGSIEGQVIEDDLNKKGPGDPIPSIDVMLLDNNFSSIKRTRTNANGRYNFANLPNNSYKVFLEVSGYQSVSDDVVLTDNNLNVDSVDFEISYEDKKIFPRGFSTSIREKIIKETQVYPNPASNSINLKFEKADINRVMHLYDINGRQVRSNQIVEKEQQINISDLESGTYFLLIESNGKIESYSRLIKQ